MWRLARHKTIDPDLIIHQYHRRGQGRGAAETDYNECRLLWGLSSYQTCGCSEPSEVVLCIIIALFLESKSKTITNPIDSIGLFYKLNCGTGLILILGFCNPKLQTSSIQSLNAFLSPSSIQLHVVLCPCSPCSSTTLKTSNFVQTTITRSWSVDGLASQVLSQPVWWLKRKEFRAKSPFREWIALGHESFVKVVHLVRWMVVLMVAIISNKR